MKTKRRRMTQRQWSTWADDVIAAWCLAETLAGCMPKGSNHQQGTQENHMRLEKNHMRLEKNHMRLEKNHMRRPVGVRYAVCVWAMALGLLVLAMAGPTSAQPVDIPPTWGGDFWSRPRLTGSWGGLRDELGKKGVVVDIDLLQIPQGVASGGRDDILRYWGLAEYTLNVDTQKLGLWPGGFLRVQGMSSFGQNVDNASGALVPPNAVSLLPEPGGPSTGLMNLTFMQFLSKHFVVVLGKASGLGADDNAFAHDYH